MTWCLDWKAQDCRKIGTIKGKCYMPFKYQPRNYYYKAYPENCISFHSWYLSASWIFRSDPGTHFISDFLHLIHVALHLSRIKWLNGLELFYQCNMLMSKILFLHQILLQVKSIWYYGACVYILTHIFWGKEYNITCFSIVEKEHMNSMWVESDSHYLMCMTLQISLTITEYQCALYTTGWKCVTQRLWVDSIRDLSKS